MNMIKACLHCGYEWTTRVKTPKSCPACKRYFKVSVLSKEKPYVKMISNISTPEKNIPEFDEITREPIE